MKEELRHKIEIEKDGRIYVLDLPFRAPLQECFDVWNEFAQVLTDNKKRSEEEATRASNVQADATSEEK